MPEINEENEISLLQQLGSLHPSRHSNTICQCCGSRQTYVLNQRFNWSSEGYAKMPINKPEYLLVSHWNGPIAFDKALNKPVENTTFLLIPDDECDALLEWRDM